MFGVGGSMSTWRLLGTLSRATTREEIRAASINGWNPWQYAWSPAGVPPIVIPSTNNPLWPLHLKVTVAGPPESEITFAAHMHENGACSFYVPAARGEDGAIEVQVPKYEGFWRAKAEEQSELPWPIEHPTWDNRNRFLKALQDKEEIAKKIDYRGFSICRLCGVRNGSQSLRLREWEWPSGFRHYVEMHQVRPTEEFLNFIVGEGR